MNLEERQPGLEFGRPRVVAREARRDEQRSVCDVLGRAFFDDPVAAYLFPDPMTRSGRYARFVGIAIDAFAGSALVLTEPEIRSGAIWLAPIRPTPTTSRHRPMIHGSWKQPRRWSKTGYRKPNPCCVHICAVFPPMWPRYACSPKSVRASVVTQTPKRS